MQITNPLEEKRDAVLRIAAQYGARDVRLFGSFAKGTAKESSDVDILVTLDPGRTLLDLVALKQDLEDLFGRRVHVVTPLSLSSYIRDSVMREAVSL
jgi:predicted nucleotidyltransferase